MADQQTPLVEADPKSLDDLYNEDPLNLTDEDIDRLTEDMRANRALWEKEEKAAAAEGRARKPKSYKPKVPKGSLSLDDIGLGKKK